MLEQIRISYRNDSLVVGNIQICEALNTLDQLPVAFGIVCVPVLVISEDPAVINQARENDLIRIALVLPDVFHIVVAAEEIHFLLGEQSSESKNDKENSCKPETLHQ